MKYAQYQCMTPTKEDVKKWLKAIGKDRFWLSEHLNTPKRTIDNWLAPGGTFPAYAVLIIQKLMNGEADSSPRIVIDFTDEEWEIICEAAKAYKETFLEFVNTAIQNAAKEKEDARKQLVPVESLTARDTIVDQSYNLAVIDNIAAGGLQSGDTMPYHIKANRPLSKGEYVLRVEGKSMEPSIQDGALVIMRRHTLPPVPKVGTIVQYDDERGVTLKKLARKRNPETGRMEYVLHPLNPKFGDIEPMDGGRISGIYVTTLENWRKA